jgi:hypothetical protein
MFGNWEWILQIIKSTEQSIYYSRIENSKQMSVTTYNPFECPVCLEFYDDNCIPTTFPCGHSCCINHVGLLESCFACRSTIPAQRRCQPNYALRDGSILFRKLLTTHCPPDVANTFLGQQEFSLRVTPAKPAVSSTTQAVSTSAISSASTSSTSIATISSSTSSTTAYLQSIWSNFRQPASASATSAATRTVNTNNNNNNSMNILRINQYNTEVKSCGHACTPSSLGSCCACMDLRPTRVGNTYPIYIDGLGWTNSGSRNAAYCPLCK